MENRFRKAVESGEFAVSCEIIPGRGAREDAQERELATAKAIWETGRVHALSITDNPGGNPALLADGLGAEMLREGIVPLVHFTCKDRSRNQMLSQLYQLERAGVENLLFMTGDYQASGWNGRARPVFDLDSVQVQMLAHEMNAGLVVAARGGETVEKPTRFFNGCVVNPFKYTEGELVPQYLKLEKKILAGADFVITQLGYDMRKMHELSLYLSERGYATPVIANVFLLTRGAARLMRTGAIAGCHVSDGLMDVLEREAAGDDKGRAARVERAAQMVAAAKGLGFAGVHIGGFGVDAQMVGAILDRAHELAADWRGCVRRVSFGEEGGHYLYKPRYADDGAPSGMNLPEHSGASEDVAGKKLFGKWRLSLFFHHWMLTLGKRGGRVLERVMDRRDRTRGVYRRHGVEHMGKALIYGCMDCGDCGLEATCYSCPMTQCPKCQRNGPCGGSMDGWCEVFPHERYCIWYMAYHRAKRSDQLQRITSFITPPNKWEYLGTSPWSNYTHRRDNCAGRIPVSLGLGGAPGGGAADGAGEHGKAGASGRRHAAK